MLVLALALADLFWGNVRISPGEILAILTGAGGSKLHSGIVLSLRLPRMGTAALAGAALALAGAQMQAIFRNPLADPHIMGVSSGAGLGAALATLALASGAAPLHGGLTTAGAAFAGAMLTSLLIIVISPMLRGDSSLLVFGVLLGFILSAISSLLAYGANAESLKLFYSWSAGSFSGTAAQDLPKMGMALAAGLILALGNSKGLDRSLFGEGFTRLSGASPAAIRFVALCSCCLLTAAVTANCGPIGFVGIVAPHIARRASGTSVHSKILPLCLLFGAASALAADLLAKLLGASVPVGSTIALVGVPIIIYVLAGGGKR